MKTILEQIKDDYAGEQGRDSWEDFFKWNELIHTSHEIMQAFYDEVAKRHATEVSHVLANDIIRDLPKNSGSNEIADYVNKWLEENLK